MKKPLAIAVLCALFGHLLLGWMWSVVGAIAGGYLARKRGWIVGGFSIIIAWAAIIFAQYIQAPYQVSEMARVMAAIVGNLPSIATYGVTLLMAALLGISGGAVGQSLASLRKREMSPDQPKNQ